MRVWRTTPEIAEVIIPDEKVETRFLEWIARDDNGEITDLMWQFCLTPPEMGGLGALPEDMDTVTRLHAGIGDRLHGLLDGLLAGDGE